MVGVGDAEQLRLSVLHGSNCREDFDDEESLDLARFPSFSGDGVGQRLSQEGTIPVRLFNGILYSLNGRVSGDTVK